jgi:7-cyano-7-deazaguanine synthase in queuosine biosynthesis
MRSRRFSRCAMSEARIRALMALARARAKRVTVTGGFPGAQYADLSDYDTAEELVQAANEALDTSLRLGLRRNPGCCQACLDNEDPRALPVHPNCKCHAEFLGYNN